MVKILFNIVLIPIEVIFIIMIIKVRKHITKIPFFSDEKNNNLKNIYNRDEKCIEEHNRNYILPPLYIGLIALIIMSISTIIFPREIYHKFITGGFIIYFIAMFGFMGLEMLSRNKEIDK